MCFGKKKVDPEVKGGGTLALAAVAVEEEASFSELVCPLIVDF
jgi:hypothetical protein